MAVTSPVGSGIHETPLIDNPIEDKWDELYKLPAGEMIKEITRIVGKVNVAVHLADYYANELSDYWEKNKGGEYED